VEDDAVVEDRRIPIEPLNEEVGAVAIQRGDTARDVVAAGAVQRDALLGAAVVAEPQLDESLSRDGWVQWGGSPGGGRSPTVP
jgi:hypothetical protein